MCTYIKIFPLSVSLYLSLSLSLFVGLFLSLFVSLSLRHSVFLTAPLPILQHSQIWEGLAAAASVAPEPSFLISNFCSHFPFHSLLFHFGDKQKIQHIQKLRMSSIKVISIRVGILAYFVHV